MYNEQERKVNAKTHEIAQKIADSLMADFNPSEQIELLNIIRKALFEVHSAKATKASEELKQLQENVSLFDKW